MLLATDLAIDSNVSGIEFSGYPSISARAASAPLLNVAPQSPSPTLRSHSVRLSSASFNDCATPCKTFSIFLPVWDSCAGRWNRHGSSCSRRTSLPHIGLSPPPRGQPGAFVSESRRYNILSRSLFADGSFRSEMEKPAMSIEVINGPATTRSTRTPFSSSLLIASRVATLISSAVALPRLFIRSATESPPPRLIYPRSLLSSVMIFSISPTTRVTGRFAMVSAPGSPWIPRPISIMPSGIRDDLRRPGIWHTVEETPIDATHCAACNASSFTALRLRPASAAAPATLCTKHVPAIPRRPVTPLDLGMAQSSATKTISTGIPSERACSAAIVKLIRSPV
mmetsp:Transcript_27788/g.44781  ORF Transcript_27788/g.44781 Transcript_27788/m.44781 type:complete len:339 (-) Transcript_27788:47-1063(-)